MEIRKRSLLCAMGTLCLVPLAWAQAPKSPYRIAFPSIVPRKAFEHLALAFEQGLQEHGYVLGRDVVIEYRDAGGKVERYAEVAAQAVNSRPDVLVVGVNAAAQPLQALTRTIPIVMLVGTDVVHQGFAQSLARPGRNVTGVLRDVAAGTVVKRLELLRSALPHVSRVAVLFDPPYEAEYGPELQAAAPALRVKLTARDVTEDFERTFAPIAREADAVLTQGGPRMFSRRAELVALAARHRLPAIYHDAEYVDAGGLMSYGVNLAALFRAGGRFVHRILKGANPAELPFEQPTEFDFVINLKTARTLSLKLPQAVLLRAARVVE